MAKDWHGGSVNDPFIGGELKPGRVRMDVQPAVVPMHSPDVKPGWTDDQVRKFVKDIKARIGPDGWRFMTPEVRRAFVDSACLSIVLSQITKHVDVDKATLLRNQMHTIAGTS